MRPLPTPLASGEIPLASIGQTFLYRLHDSGGDLLYIGVTDDLSQRLENHRRIKDWFHLVRRITWERYATREDAERAETHWIHELVPQFNWKDNHRRIIARELGHRTTYEGDAWRRLGRAIRAAREAAQRTQKATARQAGVSAEDLRSLERGEKTSYAKRELQRIEWAIGWRPGSFEAVLAGGDPDPMNAVELLEPAPPQQSAPALEGYV